MNLLCRYIVCMNLVERINDLSQRTSKDKGTPVSDTVKDVMWITISRHMSYTPATNIMAMYLALARLGSDPTP